jgi:nitroreductase
MALTTCTIALSHLELAATGLTLGACWAGYFNAAARNYPPMREALNLPKGHICQGAMLLGFPKYPYYRIPERKAPVITWR